jgi:hypothetical protein
MRTSLQKISLCVLLLGIGCATIHRQSPPTGPDVGRVMDEKFRELGLRTFLPPSPSFHATYHLDEDKHGLVMVIEDRPFGDLRNHFLNWLGKPYMRAKTVEKKWMLLYAARDVGIAIQVNEVSKHETQIVAIRASKPIQPKPE